MYIEELAGKSLLNVYQEYLSYCEVELGLRAKTLKGKRESLLRFIHHVGRESVVIETCRNYMAYLREKGWQISSIHAEFRHIRAFVTFLFDRKYISENWGRQLKLPRLHKKEMEIVPGKLAEEIILAGTEIKETDNKLAKARKTEARECLLFILKTGLRNFEARKLESRDFNLEEETYIVESKGGDRVRLPIPRDMIEMLRLKISRKGKVFRTCEARLQHAMSRGCRLLGVAKKIRVHTLRHICATELLKAGVPIQNVRRLLRHADIRITDSIYAHVDVGNLAKDLNRSSLISRGMSPTQMFNLVQELVEGSGIKDNSQYRYLFSSDPGKSLQITIQVKQLVAV